MTAEHDIDWHDGVETVERDADDIRTTITVRWRPNLHPRREGGDYSVWIGDAIVDEGLTLRRAKDIALRQHDETGRPIEESVEVKE